MFSLYGRWEAVDRWKMFLQASLVILVVGKPCSENFYFLICLPLSIDF